MSEHAIRGIGINTRRVVFAPSAAVGLIASTTVSEKLAVGIASVSDETVVVLRSRRNAFAIRTPDATIISARIAVFVHSTIWTFVKERTRANSRASVDTRVSIFTPSTAVQFIASITSSSDIAAIGIAIQSNRASSVWLLAKTSTFGITPDTSLVNIGETRSAISVISTRASVLRHRARGSYVFASRIGTTTPETVRVF